MVLFKSLDSVSYWSKALVGLRSSTLGNTVANIFALFILTTEPHPWSIVVLYCRKSCLVTAQARRRRTDGKAVSMAET